MRGIERKDIGIICGIDINIKMETIQKLPLSKPKRYTSKKYIAFIKSKSCLISRTRNPDPHHYYSRGSFGSDLSCIPLSRKHHAELEQIGESRFLKKYNLPENFFLEAQIRLLQEYIEKIEHG